LVKFGFTVFELCEWTDRQIDILITNFATLRREVVISKKTTNYCVVEECIGAKGVVCTMQ